MKRDTFINALALVHGGYLSVNGIWPLLDIPSYEAFTGAKSDHWLLRCMAGIFLTIGAVLLWSLYNGFIERPVRSIVTGVSGVVGTLSMISALNGTIHPIHIMDGGIHLGLAICWIGIMLSADSPYRPKPVATAKRSHQRT